MAIRIDFYAVEIPPFEEFLNRPLWDCLTYLAEHARESMAPQVSLGSKSYRPPERPGSIDWNDWVHEMLGQLLSIEALGFDRPNIVSFID